MLSQNLSRRLFSSSCRFFSRLPVSSSGNQRNRPTYRPSQESLGLDPMTEELSYLWSLRTSYAEGDVKATLLNDNSFRGTCALIMKKLRYMRPEQVRSLAHLVLGINLPTNIGITKGALQMLRVHLHEYDAKALSDIYFLLVKNRTVDRDPEDGMEPTNPTLEALLLAIPKALEIKIIEKKFSTSPDNLLLVLKASTAALIDINTISFLLKVILNKLQLMDVVQLNKLLGILCHPHIESNLDLIDRSLVEKILEYSWNQIVKSLYDQNFEIDYYFDETIKSLAATSDPIYYNPNYCDTIYNVYEQSDSFENFNALDDFLAFTIKYNHYSTKALEKISSLIVANPKSFLWDTPLSSANIVQILGRLNWLPNNVDWKILRCHLYEELKLSGSPFYSPVETLISFLILRDYEAFEDLFESEENNLINDNSDSNEKTLETVYNNLITLNIGVSCEADVSTIKSTLSSIMPKAIDFLNSIHKPDQFQLSLSSFLALTCGGQQKVLNNVWTSYGHFIPNLLMITKDGKLSEFVKSNRGNQTGIKFLNDYAIDSEAILIAVIPLTDNEFNTKPYRLKGQFDLKFRTLEYFHGMKILKIHWDTWECLSDREKCSFLLRELSETCNKELDKELLDKIL